MVVISLKERFVKVCFVGDIVGAAGKRAFCSIMPHFKADNGIDCLLVNAENSTHGMGVSLNMINDLMAAGADGFTLGNHAFSNKDFITQAPKVRNCARPANVTPSWPGYDYFVFEKGNERLGVFNLLGQVFTGINADDPFSKADEIIGKLKNDEHCTSMLLDFHAETTAEKIVMGRYLDGRVSVVLGTHTHVPTADERIFPGGTGYITDVGMTGSEESVIGMRLDASMTRLVNKMPARYEPATGPASVCGIVFSTDASGRCLDIRRFCEYE